ncbi:RNase H-like domain found in reverse transcriptase [Popillia japonica]|uniref:RNA-directed DNA polymerase n=1 Tax=Popillia japonica TaxID=7064 RepID=A0AAW1K2L2_POPJA
MNKYHMKTTIANPTDVKPKDKQTRESGPQPLQSENVELEKLLKIRKVNNETPYSVVPLASKPQILTCPHCQHYVTTEIAVRPSIRTHLKALLLAICCLFFIPYVCSSCMNVDHFCPECETYIGTYIRYRVTAAGMQPDTTMVQGITKFPTPKTVKHVQSFLGICNYYRRFIQNFSKIAGPLYRLRKLDSKFSWREEHEEAFCKLKEILSNSPLLRHFNPSSETELHVDASGVLYQKDTDCFLHPVAFISRTLTPNERKYPITELECLAAMWATEYFRTYLWGQKFTIVTDHHSLCYLRSMKSPNRRLLRWSLKLMEYSYVVVHQKGTTNKVADALSRYPCQVATTCDETKATDMLTFIATPSDIVHLQAEDTRIQDIIAAITDPDSVGPALSKISKKYEIKNGILYRRNDNNNGNPLLLVIPLNLRHEILYTNHNDPISGHLAIARTLHKIRRKFYWDGLVKDVKNYIRGCPDCQTRKGPTNQRPAGLLHPIGVGMPFERVGIDLLGPFRRSGSGKTFVVVATDYATRWVEAKAIPSGKAEPVAKFIVTDYATRTSGKAEPVAKFIVEQIICRHGSPKYLLSDRGTVFLSKMVTEVLQLLGTQSIFTTAYKPSTNGLTERFNKTLADMLSLYTSTSQKDWDVFPPHCVFAYNTMIQESTRFTPFKLVYGRDPVLPDKAQLLQEMFTNYGVQFTPFKLVYGRDPVLPDKAQLLQEMFTNYGVQTQDTVLRIREQAQKNIQHQQQRDKERYDKKHTEVSFNIGDKVKVRTPLRQVGKSEKLLPKYFGPYTVVEKRSDVNYVIETGSGNRRKRDVIHVSRIVPYYDPWTE